MMKKLSSLSLICLALACDPRSSPIITIRPKVQTSVPEQQTPTPENKTSSSSDKENKETEEILPKITGGFLSCAREKTPSLNDPTARVSCGFLAESTQKKADPATFVSNAVFTLETKADVTATKKVLVDDPEWDVTFDLSGTDPNTIAAALNEATLQLQATTASGPASLSSTLSLITRTPIATFDLSIAGYSLAQTSALKGPNLAGAPQLACAATSKNDNGVHLGRVVPATATCAFAYGVAIEESAQYLLIAASPALLWIDGANRSIPPNAIGLGREANGAKQYLCRATVVGQGQIFGKIATGYDGCNLAGTAGYLQVNTYQVLAK